MLRAARSFQRGVFSKTPSVFSQCRLPAICQLSSTFATDINSSFLSGANAEYIDEMYHQWSQNPASVHASWDVYFTTGSYTAPPTLVADYEGKSTEHSAPRTGVRPVADGAAADIARVVQYIRAFQVRGHLRANLDPLKFETEQEKKKFNLQTHEELHLANYGFSDADLDRVIDLSVMSNSVNAPPSGLLSAGPLTLRQISNRLKEIYCGNIGFEYMHIPDVEKCNWIRENIETVHEMEYTIDQKTKILNRVTWADHFERVLAQKYTTAKRFGLEGAEAFIPGVKALLDTSTELGMESMVIGMPHRGRLNVLSTVLRKPLEIILSEFDGTLRETDEGEYSGDVKYHLGESHERLVNGKKVHVTLMANPSHLEAVNTCVLGKVRAKQFFGQDKDYSKHMGLILHGDAAFSGQGIVYETLGLGDLPDYSTGGTVHLVVNNQIGFTTDPFKSRSSPYCTDVAKAVGAPIFHVNGDDPESVVRVCELAAQYRAKFKSDVVIDIVCYRKHGHNEIDEPSFTQPLMYDIIRKHPSVLDSYTSQLHASGAFTEAQTKAVSDKVHSIIEEKFVASKSYTPPKVDALGCNWDGMLSKGAPFAERVPTGIEVDELKRIAATITKVPDGFNMHRRLKGINEKKSQALQEGTGLDWSCGEALAFGSLLAAGTHVRLSGQDVERGTFSHRHAVWHDQKTGDTYTALNNLGNEAAHFSVSNSNLSEYGVLGFELGYSMEHPNSLVMWEAQFGDFANGAQIMIDQFICSQEDKWLRQSGLVMLLPHGYEGMGPEHSSARLERYLQLCDSDLDNMPPSADEFCAAQHCNMQVIYPTTPANIFHALRRQVTRKFRKPLVVMSPKSLLRHPDAKSDLSEMGPGTCFKRVIEDQHEALVADADVKRVVICSGKVYYDLASARAKQGINDIAIVRLEQLNPFPFHNIRAIMAQYSNAEIMFCQEEPKNQGAWAFVRPALETCAIKGGVRPADFVVAYAGRRPMAATSTGHAKVHHAEQEELVRVALTV